MARKKKGKKKTPEQLAAEAAAKAEEIRLKYENDAKDFHLGQAIMKVSSKFIDVFEKDVFKIKYHKNFSKKWKKMFKHGKYPLPFECPKIREFVAKLGMQLSCIFADEFDWSLNIDERSLLQQNLNRVDCSRKTLKSIQIDVGTYYSKTVGKIEFVISDILEFLTENERKISTFLKMDIYWILLFIRSFSKQLIDRHTFHIIRNIEQNMRTSDSITSVYDSSSPFYKIELWTFREVPIRPRRFLGVKSIDFKSMNVVVVIPSGIVFNAAVRGIWHHYDHLSDFATSLYLPKCDVEIPDLKTAQCQEWDKINELIAFRLQEMRESRLEYEEALRIKEEKEHEAKLKASEDEGKKGKKSAKPKKEKKVKIPIEPPIVTEGTVVDVTEDFAAWEEVEAAEFLLGISPESLGLEDYELNLRKYRIMGGTYSIHFLDIPSQPKTVPSSAFQFTYITIPNELKYIDYKKLTTQKELDLLVSKTDESSNLFSRKSKIEAPRIKIVPTPKHKPPTASEDNPMRRASMAPTPKQPNRERTKSKLESLNQIQIEICLPPSVFWWEEPLVYLWQPWEDKPSNINLKENIEYSHLQPTDVDYGLLTKKVLKDCSNVSEIRDFNFCDIPLGEINLRCLALQHIIPRTPLHFQFLEEIAIDIQREIADRYEVDSFKLGSFVQKQDFQKVYPNTLFPVEPKMHPLLILDNPNVLTESQVQRKHCHFQTLSIFLDEIAKFRASELPKFQEAKKQYQEAAKSKDDLIATPKSVYRKSMKVAKFSDSATLLSKTSSIRALEMADIPSESSIRPSALSTGCWSSEHIQDMEYHDDDKRITFTADRMGTFGIALRRYVNFPFKGWTLRPDEKNPQMMLLVLTGPLFKILIEVTADGYAYEMLQPRQKNVAGKTWYNLLELKEVLRKQALDIFPERDAICYITEHCEKHISMEMHTYKCMGLFCHKYQYEMNIWNQYSVKRLATVSIGEHYAKSDEMKEVMVTPNKCNFVEIEELCTDLAQIHLAYHVKPEEQDYAPDLYNLLMTPQCKNPNFAAKADLELKWNVSALLQSVRVLSFSRK